MVCKGEEKSETVSEESTEILNSLIAPECYQGEYVKNSYKTGRQIASEIGL